MIVWDGDVAYVQWDLASGRAPGMVRIRVDHFLALAKVSNTEADFRRMLFDVQHSDIVWRTPAQKAKRKAAAKAAAGAV